MLDSQEINKKMECSIQLLGADSEPGMGIDICRTHFVLVTVQSSNTDLEWECPFSSRVLIPSRHVRVWEPQCAHTGLRWFLLLW